MPALAPEKLKTLNVGRIAKFKIASTSKETIVAANMAPIQLDSFRTRPVSLAKVSGYVRGLFLIPP